MWFERLFGFEESTYSETKAQFVVEGERLRSLVNSIVATSGSDGHRVHFRTNPGGSLTSGSRLAPEPCTALTRTSGLRGGLL